MNYTLQNTRYREYELHTEQDYTIGALTFDTFSMKADMYLASDQNYRIASTGFWANVFEISAGDKVAVSIKYDWNGMTMTVAGDDVYMIKREGFWHPHFVVYDDSGTEMMVVQPDIQWWKFQANYNIAVNPAVDAVFTPFMVLAVGAAICIGMMRAGAVAASVH